MLVLQGLVDRGEVPLLGPRTSIGTFHHGAVYYYLLAPAAFLSGSDPVAVTGEIALFGLGAVAATWWLARLIGGPLAGLAAALLMAVSPAGIDASTFIWNPNLIPFASAVAFAAALHAVRSRHARWWLLSAVGAMVVMQCHVLGVVVVPPLVVAWLVDVRRRRRRRRAPRACGRRGRGRPRDHRRGVPPAARVRAPARLRGDARDPRLRRGRRQRRRERRVRPDRHRRAAVRRLAGRGPAHRSAGALRSSPSSSPAASGRSRSSSAGDRVGSPPRGSRARSAGRSSPSPCSRRASRSSSRASRTTTTTRSSTRWCSRWWALGSRASRDARRSVRGAPPAGRRPPAGVVAAGLGVALVAVSSSRGRRPCHPTVAGASPTRPRHGSLAATVAATSPSPWRASPRSSRRTRCASRSSTAAPARSRTGRRAAPGPIVIVCDPLFDDVVGARAAARPRTRGWRATGAPGARRSSTASRPGPRRVISVYRRRRSGRVARLPAKSRTPAPADRRSLSPRPERGGTLGSCPERRLGSTRRPGRGRTGGRGAP